MPATVPVDREPEPPDQIARQPASQTGRWTQSVRQVAAGGDSGKLQTKMAMQAVAAVFVKRPAARTGSLTDGQPRTVMPSVRLSTSRHAQRRAYEFVRKRKN